MKSIKLIFTEGIIKASAILCLLLIPPVSLNAESFKASGIVTVPISASGNASTAKAGINDCIIIQLPEDMTFIDGVELSFKFPTEIAMTKGAVAWSFYDGVFPSPTEKNLDYSGVKTASGTFGNTYSLNMRIPLKKDANFKKDNYSFLVQSVPEAVDGKILMRLQPTAKNPDERFSSLQIKVSGKPLFTNKGQITIDANYPDGEKNPYTLLIDGSISGESETLFLSPGIHTLSLVSDYYRNEQRTVTIEPGKRHSLRINLKSIIPELKFTAPDGTRVYIDGNHIPSISSPVQVTQGEHSLRFIFGNYETIKTLTVENGRTYSVSIFLDADITEEGN